MKPEVTRSSELTCGVPEFFDPGFNVIDSTIMEQRGRYLMVFKDERVNPVKKNLRLAWADHAEGPYRVDGDAFTAS